MIKFKIEEEFCLVAKFCLVKVLVILSFVDGSYRQRKRDQGWSGYTH